MARETSADMQHKKYLTDAIHLLEELAVSPNTFYSFPHDARTLDGKRMATPGARVIEGKEGYTLPGTGVVFDVRGFFPRFNGRKKPINDMLGYIDLLVYNTFERAVRAGGIYGSIDCTPGMRFYLVDKEIPITLGLTDGWVLGEIDSMAVTVRADGHLINAFRQEGEYSRVRVHLAEIHALLVLQARSIALTGKLENLSGKSPDKPFCVLKFDMSEVKEKYPPTEFEDFLHYAVTQCIDANFSFSEVGRGQEEYVHHSLHMSNGRLDVRFSTDWMRPGKNEMEVVIGHGGWREFLNERTLSNPERLMLSFSTISERLLFGITDTIRRPKITFSEVPQQIYAPGRFIDGIDSPHVPRFRSRQHIRTFTPVKGVRILA